MSDANGPDAGAGAPWQQAGPPDPPPALTPPPPVAPPPTYASPPPQQHATGGDSGNLAKIGLAALIVGLLIAVVPFLSWFKISFAGAEASVNGFGMESSDSMFDSDEEGSGTTSEDESDEDDLGWILEPIPDGVLVSALGVAAAAIGWTIRSKGSASGGSSGVGNLAKVLIGTGAVGLIWVAWSWFRVKAEWDDMMGEAVRDEPFAAMFLASLSFDPGIGLILSGLGFLLVVVGGILVLKTSDSTAPSGPQQAF